MRRLIWAVLAGALALTATGLAVAAGRDAETKSVTATFAASAAADALKTRTCTSGDGTYTFTHGLYRGAAASDDPRLNGPIALRLHSVYNATEKLGVVEGTVHFSTGDDDGKGSARLHAVNADGRLTGTIVGGVRAPGAKLVANFSAQLSGGTIAAGTIGSGTPASTAAVVHGGCTNSATAKASVRVARGEVTAVSATSLAVKVGDASITFALSGKLAERVTELALAVGSKVELVYAVRGETTTLVKLRRVS